MLKAPGERPGRHVYTWRHLFLLDLLDLRKLSLPVLPVMPRADVVLVVEHTPGAILTAQIAASQGYSGEDAKVLFLARRKYLFFRYTV